MQQSVLDSALVTNIHTGITKSIDSQGNFKLSVSTGDLIEFRRNGYQSVRLRISNEKSPSYYVINLQYKEPFLDVEGNLLAYKMDSIAYDNTYYNEIHGTSKGENNSSGMGFSLDALSKQTRQRWAFQKMHSRWQMEKYVDAVFNEELVQKITYLKGNDLKEFMRIYRPSAEFLRNATDYEFLHFIKRAYSQYQQREKY